jgi:hypothetical protein
VRTCLRGPENWAASRSIGILPHDRYIASVCDVTEIIGESEVAFREAERCEVFDAQPERRAAALARGRRYNELALRALREDLPLAIEAAREALLGLGEVDTQATFEAAEEFTRDSVIDLDISVYDAREARGIINAKFEAGRQGPAALCDSMLNDVGSLVELRERREGQNDPVAVGVAGVLTAGFVAYMVWVSAPGGPGWNPGTIALAIIFTLVVGGAIYGALGTAAAAGAVP